MKPSRQILLVATLLLGVNATHAQVVISQTTSNSPGSVQNNGQSFTPSVHTSGTFTDSSAYLTQFTFGVGAGGLSSTPSYLLIYSTLSGGAFSGLLQSSANTQTFSVIGAGNTATYSFAGNVALDVNTLYYAVFSASSSSFVQPNDGVRFTNSNVYSGGTLLHDFAPYIGGDAQFSATFATSAIPEPSTYAAFAGLAAIGLAAWRRRTCPRSSQPTA